jgi:hypothetical protein
MFRKMVCVVLAAVTCGLIACVGPNGKGEGESCSSPDDCGSDLTCQPVTGRSGDFCCPTPADTSTKSNCQSADAG